MEVTKGMKGILLLSGGIDFPVAGNMMLDRDLDLILLHMDNRPFTDDREFGKVKRLASRLSELAGRPLPFYVAKHGLLAQAPTAKSTDSHYHCILCRRTMLRVAERLAKQEGASFIVTGESMGQVASQTLRNLGVEENVVSIPILRPLVGLDISLTSGMAFSSSNIVFSEPISTVNTIKAHVFDNDVRADVFECRPLGVILQRPHRRLVLG